MLIFIHEMGHVVQLRREGIKATAPMFIPFMGAVISARSLGENALAEARVGLAGPILGTVGAAACLAIGEATNSDLLRALAYVGFFLNLFNLLPVVPLDGGRAMAAMSPWMWFLGFGVLVAMVLLVPNPILLIIVVFAGLETCRRWKLRESRSLEQAAYYRVAPRHRLIVASRVHRPDRAAGVRDARGPRPLDGDPQLQLDLAAGFPDPAFDLALGLPLADRLAFVVEVLAPRQGDLDLGVGTLEVDPGGHEREAPLLRSGRRAARARGDAGAACGDARGRGSRGRRDRTEGCGPSTATAPRRGSRRSRPSAGLRRCAAT